MKANYLIYASCDAYNAKKHYHNERVLERDGATPVKWVHSDNYGKFFTKTEALKELEKYAREIAAQHDDVMWVDAEDAKEIEAQVCKDHDKKYKASWYKGEGVYTTCEPEEIYLVGGRCIAYDTMTWGIEEEEEE